MSRVFVIFLIVCLATVSTEERGPVQSPEAQTPIFSLRAELVVAHVTVKDRQGAYVTSLPEEAFRVFEAGHRDTFFRPLRRIQGGDEIRLATLRGTFRYRVIRHMVVEPDELWVVDSSPTAAVTLITCYPFDYIGPAPRRFDTYTWNGELVSLDTTAKTLTVKSRVAYQEAISELKNFKAGDRVWIVWSGVHDSSDAVRQIRRPEIGRKIDENLVLPAELVSTETPNQYLTIRIKVPESALATTRIVKPGEWVTVTSRHQPSTEDEAVVSVRPYGASTPTE